MDKAKIKAHLPTVSAYLSKRRKAKENRLPKHLRPPEIWPIGVQIVLNVGILVALVNMIIDRDDYLTETVPAILLVICLMFLIYTLIKSVQLRRSYEKVRGQKLAKINFGLMILAFLSWAATMVMFLS